MPAILCHISTDNPCPCYVCVLCPPNDYRGVSTLLTLFGDTVLLQSTSMGLLSDINIAG